MSQATSHTRQLLFKTTFDIFLGLIETLWHNLDSSFHFIKKKKKPCSFIWCFTIISLQWRRFFFQARLVMLFISACTFTARWIAKPKPLVDNMLSVSRCYSSLNCINVARSLGKLFVFLSHSLCMCVYLGIVQPSFFPSLTGKGCVNMSLLSILWKFPPNWNFRWILKVCPRLLSNPAFRFTPSLFTYNTATGCDVAPTWWDILLNKRNA